MAVHVIGSALLVFATSCVAIDDWVVRVPSPSGSNERVCINRTQGGWEVAVRNDRLVVAPNHQRGAWEDLPSFLRPRMSKERMRYFAGLSAIGVDDGFLVGSNAGEWGGSVDWCTETGHGCYTILHGNPIGFASVGDRVLVVEGLAHLSINHGAVHYLMESKHGRWFVESKLRLGEAPLAFTIASDDALLILTRTGILALRDRQLRRVVTTDLDWVIPNSIAAVGDDLYIGMNSGVARLELTTEGYQETWLVPPNCRAFDDSCACVAE